ncbi:MAG: CinA family protein [Candidatus Omnitrophota bacterium]
MLEKDIFNLLTRKKKTLSVAESATGGLISHRLTNVAGSSLYFVLGVVSYSNKAKMSFLKVPENTIKNYGAVSRQTALSMAKNLRSIAGTDFSLAISGIAGPTGATSQKPLGLFYIALSSKNRNICQKFIFKGKRLEIKKKATQRALILLKKFIS